jgi:6-pyruvoyltetrahydropterin/6-carboxytetrahydropterin synthase
MKMEVAVDVEEMATYLAGQSPVIVARRYHDFSCGHRVHNHEGKCALLHGHNYRVTFSIRAAALDEVGRVLDFSVIKELLCTWLEEKWDHRFLAWEKDDYMQEIFSNHEGGAGFNMVNESIVWVPFNPTAENMALHLLQEVGPTQLYGTGAELIHVSVEETRKCRAEVYK